MTSGDTALYWGAQLPKIKSNSVIEKYFSFITPPVASHVVRPSGCEQKKSDGTTAQEIGPGCPRRPPGPLESHPALRWLPANVAASPAVRQLCSNLHYKIWDGGTRGRGRAGFAGPKGPSCGPVPRMWRPSIEVSSLYGAQF